MELADPQYTYHLPESLIAKEPAVPRDAARLFVYDTARDAVALDTFAHLGDHLPPQSLLVLNDTKVVPARALLRKAATGGKVEVLFLVNEWDGKGPVPAIVDRKVDVGARIAFGARTFIVARQDENIFWFAPEFPVHELIPALMKRGVTPIPKYIKGSGLGESALRKKYQSVFGETPASVAAPTASLHFTDRLLRWLAAHGVKKAFVTLHVGMGTFAPVTKEDVARGTLHAEHLSISAASRARIRAQKDAGRPVVAVGTTVVRTLESQADALLAQGLSSSPRTAIDAETRMFIRPPYRFKAVDAMVTNFHLPGTSLMMLVQAFLEHKGARKDIVALYEKAIKEKFRFYSFGDGMLIK